MNLEQAIELVEKWIADPESVNRKELRAALDTTYAYAAYTAADTCAAKFWVAEYPKLIKDNVC